MTEAAPQSSYSAVNGKMATSQANEKTAWTPTSWKSKPVTQEAIYEDQKALAKSLAKLERLPPLVSPVEIVRLKKELRDVALGKAFLLQGGDCAELFDYCEESAITAKIKLLLQMSLVLIQGTGKPLVRIGRMAGQYAKPRSSATEVVDGKTIPSFRGDILNGYDVEERALDPSRMVSAYHHSAATLNFIRTALASGVADLHRPLNWSLGHVQDPELQAKYTSTVKSITESLKFMGIIGADKASQLLGVEMYTSHEGLLLLYEQSLTRRLPRPDVIIASDFSRDAASTPEIEEAGAESDDGTAYYNTSAHFLWIGDRTRQLDGAHVEYFRGIENPIGVKIGPTTSVSDLLALLRALNPKKEVGKITLITRYGAQKVQSLLPAHIRAVEDSEYKRTVVWQCDPMHGNTRSTPTGIKTRKFGDIFSELEQTLQIHQDEGSYLGGIHLELTGEAVTECMGGSEGLVEEDLSMNYTTYCDPRLNEKQALEMAFLVAGLSRDGK